MKHTEVRILIFANDQWMRECSEGLRSVETDFGFHWKFELASDNQTALEKFRLYRPDLILVGDKLPETTPLQFAKDLFRVSSEMSLFLLSSGEHGDNPEFDVVPWPIISWAELADQLILSLRLDQQERLGGRKHSSRLRIRLAKHYENTTQESIQQEDLSLDQTDKYSWIPRQSQKSHLAPAPINTDSNSKLLQSSNERASLSQTSMASKVSAKSEWLLLSLVFVFCMLAWSYQPEDELVLLSGFRLLSSIVVGAGFLGFFVTRFIR